MIVQAPPPPPPPPAPPKKIYRDACTQSDLEFVVPVQRPATPPPVATTDAVVIQEVSENDSALHKQDKVEIPEKRPYVCDDDFLVDPDDEIIMETNFFKFKPGL